MTDGAEVQEITFQQALDCTQDLERNLLLGNGFSIAAHEGFDYRQLLDRAGVPDDIRGIFAAARTSNFEAVMRILLTEAPGAGPAAVAEAQRKIKDLKAALIRSVHEVHPPRRNLICSTRWARCEEFLAHFIGKERPGGRVFTTNYDLLLSWAVGPERDRKRPDRRFKNPYEGFRGGPYGHALGSANIIYLHGALHLAKDRWGREKQLQYWGTGIPLHDQIAAQLERGDFPIFVSEGASSLKRPNPPGYLSDAFLAFQGTCNSPAKKALFTLGHGLGPEDTHILGRISEGWIPVVYLGAFGRKEMDAFQSIAASWIAARAKTRKPPLKVYIFDSTDVVWGPSQIT